MHFLDFLFPKRCVGCGRVGQYFCTHCQATIIPIYPSETICPMCEKGAIDGATHPRCQTRYSLDGLTSFFHYKGVVRKAVKALKYRLVSDITAEFVSFTRPIPFSGILIPIPLHISRLRERGFNQAEVLGKLVAQHLGIPLRTNVLVRTKKTVPQVAMKDKKERLVNMKDVFAVSTPALVVGADVVLFDDVFTTGATMRAACAELKKAGARRVWALTMAR